MSRRELFVVLSAVSLAVGCKAVGPGVGGSFGKPSPAPGNIGNLTCQQPAATMVMVNGQPLTENVVNCTLDFGGVPIGQSVTTSLSIGNDSASSYQITGETLPTNAEFVVQQLQNLPIEVFTSVSLAVTFKPFSEMPASDTFSISTDSQTVSKVVFTVTGTGIKLALGVNPTSIDFKKVIVHSSLTLPLKIYNLSTGNITLSPISPQGVSQSLFTVAPADPTFSYSTPIKPDPNNPTIFNVTFTPKTQSYADETAYLVVGYAKDKFINVGLKGFGVKSGLLVSTAPVATPPTAPYISFGHIPLLASTTDKITVQNISNQVINLFYCYLSDSAGGAFIVGTPTDPGSQQIPRTSTTPLALQPGQTLEYPITFAPVLGQGYFGTFSISSDHGDNMTIPITGGGGGPAISCVTLPATPAPLALNFGYVAVNIGASLSLQCTNTGNDIYLKGKLDTSGELQIYASDLQITQPGSSYSVQLLNSNGQATGFVSVLSGQSFQVTVNYDPIAATTQPETGTLLIPSNATLTPVLTVQLSGQALKLTDCNLSISPNSLNFEQITVGQTVELPVILTNNGNKECLINGLSLSPSTNPAFSLVTTPASSIPLCGTSQPAGTCAFSAPSQYQTLVQFHPTAVKSYSGLINFVISSKSAPNQIVPLSGAADDGNCLIVTPQELDFGNVGVKSGSTYCHTRSHTFHALNTCSYALLVSGLQNSLQSVDFRITSSPSLPAPVQPGQFFEFSEEFEPQSAGVKWGSATIQAAPANGGVAKSYLVAFHGNADTNNQVDTYAIPPAKVDILWVVDFGDLSSFYCALVPSVTSKYGYTYTCPNSSSGNFLVPNLANFFNSLSGVDYHLAVISSVDCYPPAGFVFGQEANDQGQFMPCSNCADQSSNTAKIITNADADPAGELSDIITTMIGNEFSGGPYFEYYDVCYDFALQQYYFNGGDVFLPAYLAMQSQLLGGHNQGFLREDAALVIIGLNNTDDQSQMVPPGNQQPFFYSFFQNLKGYNPLTPFIFNAISITPAETAAKKYDCPGNNYIYLQTCYYCQPPGTDTNIPAMVQETGGQLVDICTTDWASSLTSLGTISSAKPVTFTLNGSPVNPPDGLTVQINGGTLPQYTRDGGAPVWTYDPLTGTLTFPNPSNAPGPGDVLTISYTNICY
jgi:hypothetical protein